MVVARVVDVEAEEPRERRPVVVKRLLAGGDAVEDDRFDVVERRAEGVPVEALADVPDGVAVARRHVVVVEHAVGVAESEESRLAELHAQRAATRPLLNPEVAVEQ